MKRKVILIVGVLSVFLLSGCFGKKKENLLEKFKKQVSKNESYYLSGDLEIVNHEDVYSYVVEVAYKKDNQFRVELKNKTNDHEQIILKNSEGVFVFTHKGVTFFKSVAEHFNTRISTISSVEPFLFVLELFTLIVC